MAEQDDELTDELPELEEPVEQDAPEGADAGDDGDEGETVIAFADEAEREDQDDDTALVKKLRDQIRERDRKLAQYRRSGPPSDAANDADPEPVVPDVPDIETFDYDKEAFDAAVRERDAKVSEHAEWKNRQGERERERARVADQQAQQLEQQRKSLGVSDYEERATAVKDRLTDAQIAVLTNGAHNPARLIYALGRSPSKLEQLAEETNLARFAVMLGSLERDIKVTKRNAPAVDSPVRGGTASSALPGGADKKLAALQRKAEQTNDYTELLAYKRSLRDKAA